MTFTLGLTLRARSLLAAPLMLMLMLMLASCGGGDAQVKPPPGSLILVSGGQWFRVGPGERQEKEPMESGLSTDALWGPAWNPSGDSFAFIDDSGELHVGTSTGEAVVADGLWAGARPAWSADGKYLVALWEDGCDPSTVASLMQPVRIDVASGDVFPLGTAYCGIWDAVDVAGSLLALGGSAAVDPRPALWIADLPDGELEPLVRPTGPTTAPFDLSSDGRLIARDYLAVGARCPEIMHIETREVADGSMLWTSAAGAHSLEPVWSPDGSYLAFLEIPDVEADGRCGADVRTANVVVLNVSTGAQHVVTTIDGHGHLLSWVEAEPASG